MGFFDGLFGKPKVDNSALEFQKKEAERARKEEERRQARIEAGLRDIAAIFEGGRYRSGVNESTEAVEVPELIALGSDGNPYVPPPKTGTGAGGNPNAGTERDNGGGAPGGNSVRANPNSGTERDNGVTPDLIGPSAFQVGDRIFETRDAAEKYLEGLPTERTVRTPEFSKSKGIRPYLRQRRKAQRDFLYPQLDEQQERASDDLINALAGAGLLRSSVKNDRTADLDREFAVASAKIASDIDADIAATKSNFEAQRQQLEAGLRASGDRSSATDAALRTFDNQTQEVPDFSIIPSLFEGATAGIGSAAQGYRAGDLRRRIDENIPALRSSAGTTIP